MNDSIQKNLPINRDFVLSNEIDNNSVSEIIKNILEVNKNDKLMESIYKDWKIEPIKIFINSFGGSAYDGLALIDVIEQSLTPVYTISIGSSMSMGLWIFNSGHKRFIGRHATLMFHDISFGIGGKLKDIQENVSEASRIRKMFIDSILRKSKITKEELDNIISHKKDWYISASKAIELKLADEYYINDKF